MIGFNYRHTSVKVVSDDSRQAEIVRDIDNAGNTLISTKAQFPKIRPLTFKNFMDYCHDFASAV
jgi:hypothetical protein